MRVLVDENIPSMTVRALSEDGHVVLDVRGTAQEGATDPDLWTLAQQQSCLLITTDKGFAQHRNEPHCGILIVRLRQPNRRRIHAHVRQAMADFAEHEWSGLLVTERDTVRSVYRAA
jgi:predicted nuclease of predicted toxin-antitoxin system